MTAEQVAEHIDMLRDRHERCDQPCKYGHIDCARIRGGFCTDETLSYYEHLYKQLTGETYD